MTGLQYGTLISAFALTYAIFAPAAGWLIDRVGVTRGASVAVGFWSLAGLACSFAKSVGFLMGCRMSLGAGESAGMPALAKVNAAYLPPSEFAMSLAVNNVSITVGSASAPLLAAAIAPRFGWRSVFLVTGAAGLLWVPLWTAVSKAMPRHRDKAIRLDPVPCLPRLLRDSRLWGLTLGNALIMTVYTVWGNWTTLYLVQDLHLSETAANRHFAWIPPVCATLGGFWGGWMSHRRINRGADAVSTRLRGCWIAGAFILITALIPFTRDPAWATAAIGITMFWAMSLQMNIHILPVDIFGFELAGLSVSVLACSFGVMQMFLSAAVGGVVDRFGFAPVCLFLSGLPLAGVSVIKIFLPATPATLSASAAHQQHA